MTQEEYNEAAALVVRLRKELEHTNQHLVAHIDALTKSNAQCAEYLRDNEQLHSLLQTVAAQRDDLQTAKDDMQNALAEATKNLSYSRLAVDTMCARDKRFTSTIAQCGANDSEDIGDFIERTAAERDKLHSELVEVRAALASATEQRDSLQRTLDEWSNADTTPHERVAAEDVAEHVVPPVLNRGEPDPANDPKDAGLEFRNVVPTPEMIKHVDYWDLVSGAAAIAFTTINPGLVFWRIAGSREWRTDPCPQPLKPHGMTWQQLDKVMADKKAAESIAAPMPAAEAPMCTTCHGCGMPLGKSAQGPYYWCQNVQCTKKTTQYQDCDASPYWGPCNSKTPVRHE